jgi:hypothetical protein
MATETVKIELELPKGVVDFASDLLKFSGDTQPVEQFLAAELTGSVKGILQDLPRTFFDQAKMLAKYNLGGR